MSHNEKITASFLQEYYTEDTKFENIKIGEKFLIKYKTFFGPDLWQDMPLSDIEYMKVGIDLGDGNKLYRCVRHDKDSELLQLDPKQTVQRKITKTIPPCKLLDGDLFMYENQIFLALVNYDFNTNERCFQSYPISKNEKGLDPSTLSEDIEVSLLSKCL